MENDFARTSHPPPVPSISGQPVSGPEIPARRVPASSVTGAINIDANSIKHFNMKGISGEHAMTRARPKKTTLKTLEDRKTALTSDMDVPPSTDGTGTAIVWSHASLVKQSTPYAVSFSEWTREESPGK